MWKAKKARKVEQKKEGKKGTPTNYSKFNVIGKLNSNKAKYIAQNRVQDFQKLDKSVSVHWHA